ncbi:MAG: tyrosine-type recombinase/integrase [Bryobacterales bacterium]|nr:tyrosine-type recombinase/integrase [Bryobacterales bacterium]
MLNDYWVGRSPVERARACWLGPEIERYVDRLHERGYAATSIRRRVPVLCDFADFAAERGATDAVTASAQIGAFVAGRLKRRAARGSPRGSPAAYENALRGPVSQMLRFASTGHVRPRREARPFPLQGVAPGFPAHLHEERGLKPATVEAYADSLVRFSAYLEGRGTALGDTSPELLSSFAIDLARASSPAHCESVCSKVGVFLRYCHREGILVENLAGALDRPHSYRLSSLPRSISPQDVRRVLEAVDSDSACGRRDRAILLLLVTYGLRAGEVVRLTLDNIDWRHDRLLVPGRKAGNSTGYPLAGPVAEALVEYIRNERPATRDRRVFFRAVAPRVPIGRAIVTHTVKRCLLRADVRVQRPGAHVLRHTCVQTLVDAGFAFKAVADYVGHRSTDSTATYAKIDLDALREVACGDGEDL